jgi:hypothetical protein
MLFTKQEVQKEKKRGKQVNYEEKVIRMCRVAFCLYINK